MTSTPSADDFRLWLDAMHPRLARFEDFLLPMELLRDYSRASLVQLERLLLDRWPDKTSFLSDSDTDVVDGTVRYIGETYLRAFGGGWDYHDDARSTLAGRPFVRLDTVDPVPIAPFHLITALLGRRTGQELARVYDGQAREVAERRLTASAKWQPSREPVPGVTTGTGARRQPCPESAAWVAGVEERLGVLLAEAAGTGQALDLSPTTLPAFEQYVLQQVPDVESLWSPECVDRYERYVSYLGEVLRRHAGGEWEVQPGTPTVGNTRAGRPYLTRLDQDGDTVVSRPYGTLVALVQGREPGRLAKALAVYSG